MVLIRECDEHGNVMGPQTSDEKTKLWNFCIKKIHNGPMGMSIGRFFRRIILVACLFQIVIAILITVAMILEMTVTVFWYLLSRD